MKKLINRLWAQSFGGLCFATAVFAAPARAADAIYTGFFSNEAISGYDAIA